MSPDILDGKSAYKKVLEDLSVIHRTVWGVEWLEQYRKQHPKDVYWYGEGSALILPGRKERLVYISSECAEGVYVIEGRLRICLDGNLEVNSRSGLKYIDLGGEIPAERITSVTDFTSRMSAECMQFVDEALSKRQTLLPNNQRLQSC